MSQLNFRKSIAALTEAFEIKSSLETGTIKEIVVHFPPGCNALVEIRVWHGSTQILPEKGGIALDGATSTFGIEKLIKLGDPIRVEWINHDNAYEHTVSIIVNIEKK